MAIAERMMNARYGDELVDHHTYVIAGDGCLMEGISHEAIDMAGHLKLGKLIVLWDDNHISIDGATDLSTSTDQLARFEAAGWNVARIDGHDEKQIAAALAEARAQDDKPWLIACRTIIGFGAPTRAGTSKAHGEPLGAGRNCRRAREAGLALRALRRSRADPGRMAQGRQARRRGARGMESASRRPPARPRRSSAQIFGGPPV